MTKQEVENYLSSQGWVYDAQNSWWNYPNEFYILEVNDVQVNYLYTNYDAVRKLAFTPNTTVLQNWIDFCISDSMTPPTE